MASIDLKIYYPGIDLRTQVEAATYEMIVSAIRDKSGWIFATNILGAPLVLNIKEILALEVIKKTFQDTLRPGLSLKEIASVSGQDYRKLFHLASKLTKVEKCSSPSEKENALVMLSARRLEATDHNFDLLKIAGPARAKLKKLDADRKTQDKITD